ncbi:MAG: thiamine pyrophosphate-dependent enzyme, partial [Burkholderiales bacterium]
MVVAQPDTANVVDKFHLGRQKSAAQLCLAAGLVLRDFLCHGGQRGGCGWSLDFPPTVRRDKFFQRRDILAARTSDRFEVHSACLALDGFVGPDPNDKQGNQNSKAEQLCASIQALWTAAHHKLPITYVIPNNRSYRILKERLVSFRKTDKFVGMVMDDPAIDFVALAQSMGVPARRITDPQDAFLGVLELDVRHHAYLPLPVRHGLQPLR